MNFAALGLISSFMGIGMGVFILFLLWSIVWKGIALWYAARNGHKVWFVVLLVLNTAGILDIIYIFAIGKPAEKMQLNEKEEAKTE